MARRRPPPPLGSESGNGSEHEDKNEARLEKSSDKADPRNSENELPDVNTLLARLRKNERGAPNSQAKLRPKRLEEKTPDEASDLVRDILPVRPQSGLSVCSRPGDSRSVDTSTLRDADALLSNLESLSIGEDFGERPKCPAWVEETTKAETPAFASPRAVQHSFRRKESLGLSEREGCQSSLHFEHENLETAEAQAERGKRRLRSSDAGAQSWSDDDVVSDQGSDMSDFIVSDNASEEELRRPPRSMRKKKTLFSLKELNSQRLATRMVIEDSSDEEEVSLSHSGGVSNEQLVGTEGKHEPLLGHEMKGFWTDGVNSKLTFSPPRTPKPYRSPIIVPFTTSPESPQLLITKSSLPSPTKMKSGIPLSPHPPGTAAFWSQETTDEWNESFSPKKRVLPHFCAESPEAPATSSKQRSQMKSPKKPVHRDKALRHARKAFETKKEALASSFLHELDTEVTRGRLASVTADTGGVRIVWSRTLNTTAGRANWRRERINSFANTSMSKSYKHYASIELAAKVISTDSQLRNVLAHEFCHLADFMLPDPRSGDVIDAKTTPNIDGSFSKPRSTPHGAQFRAWAALVEAAFPGDEIRVTTKHDYAIVWRYVWTCQDCQRKYGRHSRSIDPARQLCGGGCRGRLVQTRPAPRGRGDAAGAEGSTLLVDSAQDTGQGTARGGSNADGKSGGTSVNGVGKYQAFVKKHYRAVKEANAGWAMADITKEVARMYRAEKAEEADNEVAQASDRHDRITMHEAKHNKKIGSRADSQLIVLDDDSFDDCVHDAGNDNDACSGVDLAPYDVIPTTTAVLDACSVESGERGSTMDLISHMELLSV